jgi:tight adherence protein C
MNLEIAIVAAGLLLSFFLIFWWLGRSSPQSALLTEVTSHIYQADFEKRGNRFLNVERLASPLGKFRIMLGGGPNPELSRRLMMAGYRKPYHVDVFVMVKLLLPVVAGLAVALWVQSNIIFVFILTVVAMFFVPEFWLNYAITQRRERIRLSLPDALDLLAICLEAGLGLDQAIVRIGGELKLGHPDLSQELLQINLEQRAGNPRVGAWRNMADRVAVESVRSFVNMLVQTERFGTPISRSLAAFSDALRTQRRQQAEEMAAKTTIKLVLPLVIFIFPCIFIVTVVPAVITVIESFSKAF